MTWINAEVLIRAAQRQDTEQAYRRYRRRQREIRKTLDTIRRGILGEEVRRENEPAPVLR